MKTFKDLIKVHWRAAVFFRGLFWAVWFLSPLVRYEVKIDRAVITRYDRLTGRFVLCGIIGDRCVSGEVTEELADRQKQFETAKARLTDAYPAFADKIRKALAMGFSLEEIQQGLEELESRKAAQAGKTPRGW